MEMLKIAVTIFCLVIFRQAMAQNGPMYNFNFHNYPQGSSMQAPTGSAPAMSAPSAAPVAAQSSAPMNVDAAFRGARSGLVTSYIDQTLSFRNQALGQVQQQMFSLGLNMISSASTLITPSVQYVARTRRDGDPYTKEPRSNKKGFGARLAFQKLLFLGDNFEFVLGPTLFYLKSDGSSQQHASYGSANTERTLYGVEGQLGFNIKSGSLSFGPLVGLGTGIQKTANSKEKDIFNSKTFQGVLALNF